MHIDTGSSDLWVNTPSSQICSARQDYCATGGTYDPEKSSTYKRINDDFNITYADGSGAAGDYVTDNMGIGGITLKNFQFAVGYKSSSRGMYTVPCEFGQLLLLTNRHRGRPGYWIHRQ